MVQYRSNPSRDAKGEFMSVCPNSLETGFFPSELQYNGNFHFHLYFLDYQ